MAQKKRAKKKDVTVDEAVGLQQAGNIEDIRSALNQEYKAEIAPEVTPRQTEIQPSGILSLDLAVGNGGFVTGRVMDIFGWEGTGKTLTCMAIGGYIQRCKKYDTKGNLVNKIVALIDAEGTFDMEFGRSAGLDTDNLLWVKSEPGKILSGEDFFDIMVKLVGLGVDYIIADSCPAFAPAQVIINQMGQGQKATLSQLMSEGLQKLTPIVNANGKTLVHFINQMRGKPMDIFKSEQETGGNALKFYSSYRFKVRKTVPIEKKVLGSDNKLREKVVGVTSCIEIIKNKTCPKPPPIPGSTYHFEFDVYFESFRDETGTDYHRGVDVVKDYCETGIRTGVIVQSGSWFNFGDIKGQGKLDLYHKVRQDPQIMTQIRDQVLAKVGGDANSSDESTIQEDGEE